MFIPKLRKVYPLLIALFSLAATVNAQQGCGGANFLFYFHNNPAQSNVIFTCGTIINTAHWAVTNDTCVMTSDTMWLDQVNCGAPNNQTIINVRIDRAGNATNHDDFIIINIYCSENLASTDTIWGDWAPASGNSNVRDVEYIIACSYPKYVILEIIMGTNDNNARLKIFDNETCVICQPPIVLPELFRWIKGEVKNNQALINFSLYTTEYLKGEYVLEKSSDGVLFEEVNRKTLLLGQNAGTSFNIIDPQHFLYIPFYRIRLVDDNNETIKISETIKIESSSESGFSVHPNPVNSGDNILLTAEYNVERVQLISMSGRVIPVMISESFSDSHHYDIDIAGDIPSGMYFLSVLSQNQLHNLKILVK